MSSRNLWCILKARGSFTEGVRMSSTSKRVGSRPATVAAGVVAFADVVFTATRSGSLGGSMAWVPLVVAAGCSLTLAWQAHLVRAAQHLGLVDPQGSAAPRDAADQ